MRYDAERNLLSYSDSAASRQLLSQCQGARRIGGNIIVPAVLGNLQTLRRLDLPIVMPLDRDYDWPLCAAYARPTHVQRLTANFLVCHPRAFCLNDMGSMKTLSALWAADYLMQRQPGLKAAVAAPLSILKDTWGDEISRNFLGRRSYAICHGSPAQRLRELERDVDFYIINTDGLSVGASVGGRKLELDGFARTLRLREDLGLWIFDEAGAYRDPSTKRHLVARALTKARPYVWLLTGSPTPHAPTDAYGLAKLVNDAFGESRTSFRRRTMLQVSQFKWVARKEGYVVASNLLRPAVRYSIDDCVDLPPCVTTPIRSAALSSEQAQLYKTFKEECCAVLDGTMVTAANEGALRWKLLQIVCGALYDAQHNTHLVDAAPRLRALDDALAECREGVIIFSPLTNVLHLLYDHLCGKEKTAYVNSEVKPAQRALIFNAFRRGDLRYIVADPATMAHGLNLTAATAIVWYAPVDKAEIYMQANKRIHRPGQTRTTQIVRIAATEPEREMYDRLQKNESMQGVLLKTIKEQGR